MIARDYPLTLPVGWRSGGDEHDSIQTLYTVNLLGDKEVAIMNRVECATHDPSSHLISYLAVPIDIVFGSGKLFEAHRAAGV